jgi:TPR repeat protein
MKKPYLRVVILPIWLAACATPVEQACEGKQNLGALVLLGGTPLVAQALAGPDDRAAACVLAASGDTDTALEMALRLRAGMGLPRRPAVARRVYAALVVAKGGTIYVYSPPVGSESAGRTIAVNTGPVIPGDARAMRELGVMLVTGEGGKTDLKRGWAWIKAAAAAGDAAAAEILKGMPGV